MAADDFSRADGVFEVSVGDETGEFLVFADEFGKYQQSKENAGFNAVYDIGMSQPETTDDDLFIKLRPASRDVIDVVMEDESVAGPFVAFGQFRQSKGKTPSQFPPTTRNRSGPQRESLSADYGFRDRMEVFGLDDGQDRLIIAFKQWEGEQQTWGAARLVRGDANDMTWFDPLVLQKCSSIRGVVKPGSEVSIAIVTRFPSFDGDVEFPRLNANEATGEFEANHLVPGSPYELRVQFGYARGTQEPVIRRFNIDPIQPGQQLDPGEVRKPVTTNKK